MADLNVWLIAVFFLLLGMIPCGIVLVTASVMDRLVALEMAGIVAVLALMLLAEGFGQPSFFDMSLAIVLLSFAGGLVFCHFLEDWL
jgi:multisubunit Na+/H+ antiporter MnhF subunit